MFAYILRAEETPNDQNEEFFRRFKETPGLLHAYSMQGEENPNEGIVVAIWESRQAAQRYLDGSPLRREVDQTMPAVTRTFYSVLDSK
ncbi:MAG: antibiotic biosynthesis monooxygenase [Chloroflexota bacterium]|nr:antibiotic biosynthesis monooxygenase [Chloroflexota bacterium]